MTQGVLIGTAPELPKEPEGGAVRKFVAIDPGSKHVGFAFFECTLIGISGGGWRCVRAQETQPAGIFAMLIEWLENTNPDGSARTPVVQEVVIEEFTISLKLLQEAARRSGKKWAAQSKDANETIECIGGVRLCCALAKVPLVRQQPNAQGQAWNKLQKYGIVSSEEKLVSHGWGPHAKSAELHGWYRVFQMIERMGRLTNQLWVPGERGTIREGVW